MQEVIKYLSDNGITYSTREEAAEADYLFHKAELEKYEKLWGEEVKLKLCERMQSQYITGTVHDAFVRVVNQGDGMTKVYCTVQLEFSTNILVKTENMDHGVNLAKYSGWIATNIISKLS
jgi:hypothetical protein